MYKVRGQDGNEYGPVTAEVLRRWIAEGRLNAQSQMQAEGTTEWKTLAEFAEFQTPAVPSGTPAPLAAGLPPQAGMSTGKPQQGLAITSLVLGLASFVCGGIITGIPAIITGHIARGKAKREPAVYGGAGMALAGLILGYVSVVLTLVILPALLLPALAKAKQRAQTINCVNNMKQICLAARIYSNDHKDTFPMDFEAMSKELGTPRILVCPGDSKHTAAQSWGQFNKDANVSYEFLLPGAKDQDVTGKVVFRCPIHNSVGMGDGSVQQQGGMRRSRPR
jgi:hypothetical protein